MDRKQPGSQGGRYVADNLQCKCAGCNYVKWKYTFEATADTVKRLREARSTWTVSESGFVALSTAPSPVPATRAQQAEIKKWAEDKQRSLSAGAEKRHSSCTITATDITRMLLDRMCAPMLFQDAVGMVLRLDDLSIDRIDPSEGYELANIRLLLNQLNMIRRECPDDEPIIRYVEGICDQRTFKSARDRRPARSHYHSLFNSSKTQLAQTTCSKSLSSLPDHQYLAIGLHSSPRYESQLPAVLLRHSNVAHLAFRSLPPAKIHTYLALEPRSPLLQCDTTFSATGYARADA